MSINTALEIERLTLQGWLGGNDGATRRVDDGVRQHSRADSTFSSSHHVTPSSSSVLAQATSNAAVHSHQVQLVRQASDGVDGVRGDTAGGRLKKIIVISARGRPLGVVGRSFFSTTVGKRLPEERYWCEAEGSDEMTALYKKQKEHTQVGEQKRTDLSKLGLYWRMLLTPMPAMRPLPACWRESSQLSHALHTTSCPSERCS